MKVNNNMKKENWIWMPHPGHFICSYRCRFFLNTCVGNYIISTLGELSTDEKYHNDSENGTWEEVALNAKYESMVFKAQKDKINKCCPWTAVISEDELDTKYYDSALEATKGHYKLCNKWSKK